MLFVVIPLANMCDAWAGDSKIAPAKAPNANNEVFMIWSLSVLLIEYPYVCNYSIKFPLNKSEKQVFLDFYCLIDGFGV